MNFENKNKDLTKVFDERYKANHEQYEKIEQEKKSFNYKMFGIKEKKDLRQEILKSHSVSSQVKRLNTKINQANNINNTQKLNNIKDRIGK